MYLAIVKPCNCSNSDELGGVDDVGVEDEDIFPPPRGVITLISSTAARRLSEWKAERGANHVSLNYHHCPGERTDRGRGGHIPPAHPSGARWAATASGVSCGLSVSDGFPNRRAHAELPSGGRMDNGEAKGGREGSGWATGAMLPESRCAFGRRGKPIWCGPSVGKTAAIYLGRLSNSNPITSSVTRLSDRWH